MSFILDETKPVMIDIAGKQFPAIFSFAAVAEIEKKLDKPYGDFIERLIAGNLYSYEYAAIVCAIIRAAGGEADEQEFMQKFNVNNLLSLNKQLGDLIVGQGPGGKGEKKAKHVSK